MCSPYFQAPATYVIGVYGQGSVPSASYLLVATLAATAVIEAEDGETYLGEVATVPNGPAFDCKYYQYVRCCFVCLFVCLATRHDLLRRPGSFLF